MEFGAAVSPNRSAVPDLLDRRDRFYLPPVAVVPGVTLAPRTDIPVGDQEQTNASRASPSPTLCVTQERDHYEKEREGALPCRRLGH